MISSLIVSLPSSLRHRRRHALFVSLWFLKIIGRLRRQSEPFILKRPLPIPADELQHHSCTQIHPFVEPLDSTVTVCLNFEELGRTTSRRRIANQNSVPLPR